MLQNNLFSNNMISLVPSLIRVLCVIIIYEVSHNTDYSYMGWLPFLVSMSPMTESRFLWVYFIKAHIDTPSRYQVPLCPCFRFQFNFYKVSHRERYRARGPGRQKVAVCDVTVMVITPIYIPGSAGVYKGKYEI